MNLTDIAAFVPQFGQMGLFIGYLLWRDRRQEEITEKRIAADLEVAESLTLMRATMEGLRRVP